MTELIVGAFYHLSDKDFETVGQLYCGSSSEELQWRIVGSEVEDDFMDWEIKSKLPIQTPQEANLFCCKNYSDLVTAIHIVGKKAYFNEEAYQELLQWRKDYELEMEARKLITEKPDRFRATVIAVNED